MYEGYRWKDLYSQEALSETEARLRSGFGAVDFFGASLTGAEFAGPIGTALRRSATLCKCGPRSGLGDITTSPWLHDPRVGVRTHIEAFRDGGAYLIPEAAYKRWVEGQPVIGRLDGQFITTKAAMDDILRSSGGDISKVKQRLGIPSNVWDEKLIRVDIPSPLLFNARLPTGLESGANSLFRWGGYTKGGLPEIIIDQVPQSQVRITYTGIKP